MQDLTYLFPPDVYFLFVYQSLIHQSPSSQNMSRITLKNMRFHAYHGVLEDEKKFGNHFLVDLSVELDTSSAEKSDFLSDTLNYQELYDLVKIQMSIPSELIEHVSSRILKGIRSKFPEIQHAHLKLTKLNPPLGGNVEGVSIELEY